SRDESAGKGAAGKGSGKRRRRDARRRRAISVGRLSPPQGHLLGRASQIGYDEWRGRAACRQAPLSVSMLGGARMKTVVVTDQNQQWFEIPDATVLTARRYLADPEGGNEGTVRLVNLCRTGRYQG